MSGSGGVEIVKNSLIQNIYIIKLRNIYIYILISLTHNNIYNHLFTLSKKYTIVYKTCD